MSRINTYTLNLSNKDRMIGTVLVFSYLFFYYVRPQEYIPGLSSIRIAGLLFLATTIWGVFHFRFFLLRTPLLVILLIAFVAFLSGIDATNVSAYKLALKYATELFPQCVALYIIFDSKERILNLVRWWCLIYFLMALITIANGGLGPGDFTYDPNDASLALSMGLPWLLYSIVYLKLSKRMKYLYIFGVLIILAAIIATGSRGGFLGLVAVLLILWWLSRKRFRIAAITLALSFVLSPLIITMLPEGYVSEMQSISNTEDETRVERLRTWEIAWIMYKHNPVVGIGGSNFPHRAGEYQRLTTWWTGTEKSLQGRVTHSLYFQVLSELGTLGTLIYLYVLFYLPFKLYFMHKKLSMDGENLAIFFALTLIVSIGAYAVAGAFISVAYYPHVPIWITMYAIFIRYIRNEKSRQEHREAV